MAAASRASATANRAATAAVIVVLLVVGAVTALTVGDERPDAGMSPYGSGGSGGSGGEAAGPSGGASADAPDTGGSVGQPDEPVEDGSAYGMPPGTASTLPLGTLDMPSGVDLVHPDNASDSPRQPGVTAGPAAPTSPSGEPSGDSSAPTGDPGDTNFAAPGGAKLLGSRRVSEQILDLTVYSPALGHNTGIRLLLPPGWSSTPEKSWPTLYMLPGYHHKYGYRMGDYRDWTFFTDIERFMAGRPVLTVLPSGGGSGFFTNWWNGGAGGTPKWETYHTQELPALLERRFGASANRAIAGLSLAGYGAVEYAADHPRMYNGVASYSGVLHTTFPGVPQLAKQMWKDAGVDPERIWGDPLPQSAIWRANDPWYKAGKLCGQGINIYLSAGGGVPGEHDPPVQQNARDLLHALQRAPRSYFNTYGLASLLETAAAVTTRSFTAKLRTACAVSTVTSLATGAGGGIDLTTNYTLRGTHRWAYWADAFRDSWPVLARSLGVPAT